MYILLIVLNVACLEIKTETLKLNHNYLNDIEKLLLIYLRG